MRNIINIIKKNNNRGKRCVVLGVVLLFLSGSASASTQNAVNLQSALITSYQNVSVHNKLKENTIKLTIVSCKKLSGEEKRKCKEQKRRR